MWVLRYNKHNFLNFYDELEIFKFYLNVDRQLKNCIGFFHPIKSYVGFVGTILMACKRFDSYFATIKWNIKGKTVNLSEFVVVFNQIGYSQENIFDPKVFTAFISILILVKKEEKTWRVHKSWVYCLTGPFFLNQQENQSIIKQNDKSQFISYEKWLVWSSVGLI